MLDLGQGPIREFQLGGRSDLPPAFEPFLRSLANIREIQVSDKIEIGTDTAPFTLAGLPGINLDQDSPDYKYTNHSAADALEAVKPDVLAQNATIMALTRFLDRRSPGAAGLAMVGRKNRQDAAGKG